MSPSLTKTRLLSLVAFAALLLSGNIAFAEEGSPNPLQRLRAALPLQRPALEEFHQEAADVREGIREERKEFRKDVASTSAQMRAETKAAMQNASTSDERRAVMNEAREEREEFRKDVASTSAAMREDAKGAREELRAKARELIMGRLQTIGQRFGGALERFDQIKARIDSRIQKLADAGTDVSVAQTASNAAGVAIQAAKDAVTAARDVLKMAQDAENPKDHADAIRTAVTKATDAIKAAHQALKDAIRALAGLTPPSQPEQESSTSNE